MAQVFRSGAFLQQCWSVHPLCVTVKRITDRNQLVLACTSCRFVHYVTIGSIVVRVSAVSEAEDTPTVSVPQPEPHAQLVACLEAHATSLSLREMDVFEDLALVRCADCRRHYAVQVSSFETHQK